MHRKINVSANNREGKEQIDVRLLARAEVLNHFVANVYGTCFHYYKSLQQVSLQPRMVEMFIGGAYF